jgi:hypothetical protein
MMAIAEEEFTRSGRRLQRDELARRAGEKGHAVRRSRRLYKELPDQLRNQARIAGARVR